MQRSESLPQSSPKPIPPFLRWAGGKRWLVRWARELIPEDVGTYHEPFLGSGALYFALRPQRACLADSNPELVETFRVVRDSPSALVAVLRRYRYNRAEYYRVRARAPLDPIDRAARLIYLNRSCWNGLYRVNEAGWFNVPYGRSFNPTVADEDVIRDASIALHNAGLQSGDFAASLDAVRPGDFVFADPPYTVMHRDNGFVKYNERIFSWKDQERLQRALTRISDRGAFFILTNADHPSVRGLYKEFQVHPLSRSSVIAASPRHRNRISELLITNYPCRTSTTRAAGLTLRP